MALFMFKFNWGNVVYGVNKRLTHLCKIAIKALLELCLLNT